VATQTRAPTSDISATGTWTGSAGSRFSLVDDYPDSAGADVLTHGTTAGNILFGFSAFTVPAGSTAVGLLIRVTARRNAGGSATFAARITFNNGNVRDGTAATPGNGTLSTHTFNWGTGNPSSATTWTVDEINGIGPHGIASIGIVSTDANPTISIAALEAEASYTPATIPGTISSTLDGVSSNLQGVVRNAGTFASTLAGVTANASGSIGPSGTIASTLAGVTANFSGALPSSGYRSFLWLEGGGAGALPGVTGSMSSTLAGVSAAFSGATSVTGTFEATLAGFTANFSGGGAEQAGFYSFLLLEAGGAGALPANPSGTIAVTLEGVSSSATLVVNDRGTLDATLAGFTAAFSGFAGTAFAGYRSFLFLEAGGAGALPAEPYRLQPYDDGVPAAYYADPGYAAYYAYNPDGIPQSLRDQVGSVSGEFSSTLGGVTMAASGLVIENVDGDIASTLDGFTMAATGAAGAPEGTIDATLEGVRMDLTGAVRVEGPIDSTLAGVTMAASGDILVPGLFASTLEGATLAASGTVAPHVTGTFGSTLVGVLGSESLRRRLNALAIRIGIGI
jgi:hypothetical protein